MAKGSNPSCATSRLRSRFYLGEISHARLKPVEHRFEYPIFSFAVDLDELPELDRSSKLFGHNRRAAFVIRDDDYLLPDLAAEHPDENFRQRLERCLDLWGYREPLGRAELVTMPRVFNYAFNPVSFFYLYRPDDSLGGVLTEVNNTFGERHFYLLQDPLAPRPGMLAHFSADKAFHVSPFYDRSGSYDFHFAELNGTMNIQIDKTDDAGLHFLTCLHGKHRPFTACQLRRLLIRAPFRVAKTMPRIVWEAAKLHRIKKLPVYSKPPIDHPMTINVTGKPKPTWRERIAMKAVTAYLGRLKVGGLNLRLPDGSAQTFGGGGGDGEEAEAPVMVEVKDFKFFTRVLKGGDIGFGEAWMAGEFDTPDLTRLLSLFVRNEQLLTSERAFGIRAWLRSTMDTLRHRRRRNTVAKAKENIHAHYDLGNEFYRRFLDPSMMYSCALFAEPDQTLDAAQANKIAALIEKAEIRPEHHVLEIGCGWGAFAIEAVRQTGCRVTGVTISEQQKVWADQRVAEAGLSDRIDIQLLDYRHIEGTFDRIVSIEMLEAVGHEFLDAWFETCQRLLKPDGIIAVQVITIPHPRYENYRNSVDWIRKYIFPGGHLPSVEILSESMGRTTNLKVVREDNIGPDYATTLAAWRESFLTNWHEIEPLGFDERFRRMWHYYLSYCEAGFANHYLGVHHLVLK